MGVEWRALRPSDLPAAQGLSQAAGWNQTQADWRGYLAFEPDGCLVAEIGGRLAGTATCIRYGDAVGWIGMVLVHPDHRRRGLGTELLARTIRYLTGRGARSVRLDATPAGRAVYLPLGFRDEYGVARFEGAATGPLPGADPFMDADLPRAADLDEEAFGVRRLGVLSELSRRDPALSFVTRSGGGISGFAIAREGREAVQLGPFASRDPAAAERLFSAVVSAAGGRRVFLDVPAPNVEAAAIVARHGFRVQRSFTRMVLGEGGPAGRSELVFGTSGAEKG
jgi:ribosomal protein S18 acetylase RimI-like enzyme